MNRVRKSLFLICGLVFLMAVMYGCDDDSDSVILLTPPDFAREGLIVTFQWRIEDQQANVIYCSDIITDKGRNPFDGNIEDRFPAGQATELEVSLNPFFFDPASFEWGVRVTACDDPDASYPCDGQSFESDIRRLRTSSEASNCPGSG